MKLNISKPGSYRTIALGSFFVITLLAYSNCGEFQNHSAVDPQLAEEARSLFDEFLIENSEVDGDRLIFQGHVVVRDLSLNPQDILPPEDFEVSEEELEIIEQNRREGVETKSVPQRPEDEKNRVEGQEFNTLAHAVRQEYLWADGVIPYVIDSNVPSSQKSIFLSAAAEWQSKTKILFIPRKGERTYLRVRYFPTDTTHPYCFASYGNQGGGEVTFGIGIQGCDYSQMVHDIGHAIGIQHEHQRCDRDNHIVVDSKNVLSGMEHAWSKTCSSYPGLTTDMGSYDFSSIMHYYSRAYAIPGTVVGRVKSTGSEFQWSKKISTKDQGAVNSLYPYPETVNRPFLGTNKGSLGTANCGRLGIRQLIVRSGGAIDRVVVRCWDDRTFTFGGNGGNVTRTIHLPSQPDGLVVGETYNWLGATLHLSAIGLMKNGYGYFTEGTEPKRWRYNYCLAGYFVSGLRVYHDNIVRSASVICTRL